MTKEVAPSALSEGMTDEQKTDWLANHIMGWSIDITGNRPRYCRGSGHKGRESWDFCPLADWNHWREVEEKIMENPKHWEAFVKSPLVGGTSTKATAVQFYMAADIPTRCKAAFLALQ